MWSKISEILSEAWIAALIIICIGIGCIINHHTGVGILLSVCGCVYLAYTCYWSLKSSGASDKGMRIYTTIIGIIFAIVIILSIVYILVDINK